MENSAKADGARGAKLSRRGFLAGAAGAATFMIVPRHVLGGPGQAAPSSKLNIAGIGVGGQGGGVLKDMAGENVIVLCDADWDRAKDSFNRFPDARRYKDYREMLAKEEKNIDAVVVATPDHHHAPAALLAMRMGKHVYVEKPMAHTIEEARVMRQVAREKNLVTQMGNNGHGGEGLRLIYEYIADGAIGKVTEVHVWSDRPAGWWPQGIERPKDTPKPPETLDWNLWLGPAPERPYNPAYAPFKWRGWFDFGTGALGDMAVHNADPAFFCLNLGAPVAVEAQTSGLLPETYPNWQIITYRFAARGDMPPVTMTWWDGGKVPPKPDELKDWEELGKDSGIDKNGILFVGDKGKMICPGWSGAPILLPVSRMKEYPKPPQKLPRSIGHRPEWIQACKDGNPKGALAGFEYSGPFTEALLVGNLAVRLGKKIEWDSQAMKAANAPEADALIRKHYREGWHI
jgi:predicted dehydrogenase